jgi:hypothetical protein
VPFIRRAILPPFFRLLGMKTGKCVYLDTPEFTEFDLVTVGQDAVFNSEATIPRRHAPRPRHHP